MTNNNPKTTKVISNSEYLNESKAVKIWLRLGNFSDSTGQGYTQGLHQYCTYHNMTPDKLIEEAEAEHGLLLKDQRILLRLSDFKENISNKSPNTVSIRMAGIHSFYRNHYIIIPTNPNKSRNGTTTLIKNDWHGFDKKVVRECLKHLNLRDRAILLTMISSGQARAEIRNLKIAEVADVDNQNITTVHLHRVKSGTNYTTFPPSEATLVIAEYRKERKYKADKMGVDDVNPYLFVTSYNNQFAQLKDDTFNNIFLRLSEKMGREFETADGTYNTLRSHNFRKFFKTQMQNSGLPVWQIEHQMGHTLNSLDKAYFIAEKSKMKENYLKHLSAVSVETEIKEVHIEESERFQKMQEANIEQAAELEEMKARMVEITELRDMVTSLTERVLTTEPLLEAQTTLHPEEFTSEYARPDTIATMTKGVDEIKDSLKNFDAKREKAEKEYRASLKEAENNKNAS